MCVFFSLISLVKKHKSTILLNFFETFIAQCVMIHFKPYGYSCSSHLKLNALEQIVVTASDGPGTQKSGFSGTRYPTQEMDLTSFFFIPQHSNLKHHQIWQIFSKKKTLLNLLNPIYSINGAFETRPITSYSTIIKAELTEASFSFSPLFFQAELWNNFRYMQSNPKTRRLVLTIFPRIFCVAWICILVVQNNYFPSWNFDKIHSWN